MARIHRRSSGEFCFVAVLLLAGCGSEASGGPSGSQLASPSSGGSQPPAANGAAAPAAASGNPRASSTGPLPDPKYLVAATGPCPEFQAGYIDFHPDGVQRSVLVYMTDAARTLDGPTIISWHSTSRVAENATYWLGQSVIDQITAAGGIVVAPTSGPDAAETRRPWDHTPLGPDTDNDERLMDELVACAREKVGIDLRRIYATGMSGGGLKTAQVALRRSGYLAAVLIYSGGLIEGDVPPDQAPGNKLPAMVLYGGPTDISPVDAIDYTAASRRFVELFRSQSRFAFLCNHGLGHSVPQDSQASAFRFMQDHPFGTEPSPYARGLPDGFLGYCALE